MTIDYLKEKKELVSVVLLCVSAVLAVSILVKVTGFFTASARAERIVTDAVAQNTEDASDIDKYFTKYKMLADALKKNNLFAPPVAKQHPVTEVTGIFGDEVIIRDKLYKVGAKVGDAKIVSIEAARRKYFPLWMQKALLSRGVQEHQQEESPRDRQEEAPRWLQLGRMDLRRRGGNPRISLMPKCRQKEISLIKKILQP